MLAGLVLAGLSAEAGSPAEETVVLANRASPASAELAAYYAQRRRIPGENVVVLDLPATASMSREDYERRLRDPLLGALRDRALIDQSPRPEGEVGAHESAWHTDACRIRFLVAMYGVPFRISSTNGTLRPLIAQAFRKIPPRTDTAAVDSELALVLHGAASIDHLVPNPLYPHFRWPPVGSVEQHDLLICARLDGPDPARIRRVIDDTLAAERYGLRGRAYFDMRGTHLAGYEVGDLWIAEAYERMMREGYECVADTGPGVFPPDYPMEDAGFYLGWYAKHVDGPFARPDFVFKPGAVAYHLHSTSAATLRSPDRHWAGPLLARGAAATMGSVFEPFLQYTPRLDVFTARLCAGQTFGEAAYLSQRALSWQITVVGDPLYRPFRHSVEAQIRHLERDGHPDVAWGYLRKVNLLVRQGRFNVALAFCREKMEQLQSEILEEKLADLYALNGLVLDAAGLYRRILDRGPSAATAARVGWKWAWMLNATGQAEQANALLSRLRGAWGERPGGGWLNQPLPVPVPPGPGDPSSTGAAPW